MLLGQLGQRTTRFLERRIQRGTINERLNIRRLTPYFDESEDANTEA